MPDADLRLVEDGTRCFLDALSACPDGTLHREAALPGWTPAHVATHVARNADALTNLITWAATGVPTPMYRGDADRAAAIERGATRSAADLLADVSNTARRFAEAAANLPDDRWTAHVVTARGREIEAAEVLWLRAREVWVHAADIDPARVAAWPDEFATRLLVEACELISGRLSAAEPPIVLQDESGRPVATIGDGAAPPRAVRGRLQALAAWVIGRPSSDPPSPVAPLDTLPALPAWI